MSQNEVTVETAEEVKLEKLYVFIVTKVVQSIFKPCISKNNVENCFW